MNFAEHLHRGYHNRKYDIEKKRMETFIDDFFHFVFFLDDHRCTTPNEIEVRLAEFRKEFCTILQWVILEKGKTEELASQFFNQLPSVHSTLEQDAQMILANDPAGKSIEEVYYAYPGFYATAVYRFAHELQRKNIPLIPRIWTEFAHSKTGIDIHPGAQIGTNFFIDHGTGIVIGETTIIGNNVKLYQGVTLGALSVSKDIADTKRHPTIEDRVTVYSNATILGGNTVIGQGSLIGGNVWITESVAPNSVVYHKGQITLKNKYPQNEPINFII